MQKYDFFIENKMYKFLCLKKFSSVEKINQGAEFCTKIPTFLKNGVNDTKVVTRWRYSFKVYGTHILQGYYFSSIFLQNSDYLK